MNTRTSGNSPLVSVIIPSLEGDSSNLNRLRDTVLKSGIPGDSLEIITAIGVRPNGRARDVGTIYASGNYLIFMDEDVAFPDPTDLSALIHFLRENEEVGLVGPAQQISPSTPEATRKRAEQMPRSHVETVDEFTLSDMVTHACMALERSTFVEIGMEHPNLISGTDPDLRHRIRQKALKVGIVPDTRVYHPPIDTWYDLVRKNARGGRRSRAVKRDYPQYHLPAEPDIKTAEQSKDLDTNTSKVSLHWKRFTEALSQGNFWWLTGQVSYLSGYLSELLWPTRKVDPIPYPDPPSPESPEWENFIDALESEGEVLRLHPDPPEHASRKAFTN